MPKDFTLADTLPAPSAGGSRHPISRYFFGPGDPGPIRRSREEKKLRWKSYGFDTEGFSEPDTASNPVPIVTLSVDYVGRTALVRGVLDDWTFSQRKCQGVLRDETGSLPFHVPADVVPNREILASLLDVSDTILSEVRVQATESGDLRLLAVSVYPIRKAPMPEFHIGCPECGSLLELKESKLYSKPVWCCTGYPKCRVKHSAHSDGRPMGVAGTRSESKARIRAHKEFDALWGDGIMSRGEAYEWLALSMGLRKADCHLARFSEQECDLVISLCRDLRSKSGATKNVAPVSDRAQTILPPSFEGGVE